jgi:Flp pilus assembly protein TadG
MDGSNKEMRSPLRRAGDAGAAMVELALVMLLLSIFIFGIISFGYLFSFRQNMTQAAAEGARAGAVAASNPGSNATAAVNDAIAASFGKPCSATAPAPNGLLCPAPVVAVCANDASHTCITVTLTYDYEHNPLLPDPPLVNLFMPKTITVSSTARVT